MSQNDNQQFSSKGRSRNRGSGSLADLMSGGLNVGEEEEVKPTQKKKPKPSAEKREIVMKKPEVKVSMTPDISIDDSKEGQKKSTGSKGARISAYIGHEYIELISDAVYTMRTQGDMHFNQRSVIEEALDLWRQNNEVQKRPDWVKEGKSRSRR